MITAQIPGYVGWGRRVYAVAGCDSLAERSEEFGPAPEVVQPEFVAARCCPRRRLDGRVALKDTSVTLAQPVQIRFVMTNM